MRRVQCHRLLRMVALSASAIQRAVLQGVAMLLPSDLVLPEQRKASEPRRKPELWQAWPSMRREQYRQRLRMAAVSALGMPLAALRVLGLPLLVDPVSPGQRTVSEPRRNLEIWQAWPSMRRGQCRQRLRLAAVSALGMPLAALRSLELLPP
jgi:hypothetical protein